MKTSRGFRLLMCLIIGGFCSLPSLVRADDTSGSTLTDVHKVLLQAAGYQADTPPTSDEQTALLQKALKMIKGVPHVYRGQLKRATQDINSALSELADGDKAHRARELIFDADNEIKAIM
jgi:hypothetical protein